MKQYHCCLDSLLVNEMLFIYPENDKSETLKLLWQTLSDFIAFSCRVGLVTVKNLPLMHSFIHSTGFVWNTVIPEMCVSFKSLLRFHDNFSSISQDLELSHPLFFFFFSACTVVCCVCLYYVSRENTS